jgi:iron complex transport system ATP-binding protein
MKVMEVDNLAGSSFSRISGGERQRVTIARALAQQTGMIVMDEPTNHLDIHHQFKLMHLLRRLNATTVIALHDINLAGRFCDTLVLMSGGSCVACGAPSAVLSPNVLDEVYHVRTNIVRQPNGTVHVAIL